MTPEYIVCDECIMAASDESGPLMSRSDEDEFEAEERAERLHISLAITAGGDLSDHRCLKREGWQSRCDCTCNLVLPTIPT